MLMWVLIVCLQFAHFQPSLSDQDDSKEDEQERVSNLKIYSTSPDATIGGNVTLKCISNKGSLPINYTLFRYTKMVLSVASKSNVRNEAEFQFTLHSVDEFYGYKCKAANGFSAKPAYSNFFNFTLKATPKNHLVEIIVPSLFFLLMVIALAGAIPLLILPWCKARKQRGTKSHTDSVPTTYIYSENCQMYSKIVHLAQDDNKEVDYIVVNFNDNKEDCRNVIHGKDVTVEYSEIVA